MTKEIHSPVTPIENHFSSYNEAKELLRSGANYLHKEWFNSNENENSSFAIINKVRIRFKKDIDSLEFENNFGSQVATIYAPADPNEPNETRVLREQELLRYFGYGIEEGHLGVVARFISLLTPEARKGLKSFYEKTLKK